MRIIADFHIHSKYSRATSKNMTLPEISKWAKWKGINIVGTGDFTHPLWIKEISKLNPLGNGFYVHKDYPDIRFVITAEISNIYKHKDKVRKVHNLVIVPDIKTAIKINSELKKIGNICSDGRPILGISTKELAKIVFDSNPNSLFIPAHIWTPWFSLLGSRSGYNHIEECFEELTPKIYAVETGLSSDPEMNWRISWLNDYRLISCSDAHSPANLGREATIFEFSKDYSYNDIVDAIQNKNNKLVATIEFFPEEGKYHFDGHRACSDVGIHPEKSIKLGKICPSCGKPLVIGVMHRAVELADKPEYYKPNSARGSIHLVPLQEIIAEVYQVGKQSKRVQSKYFELINSHGSEFSILLDINKKELFRHLDKKIAEGIVNVREKKVKPTAGFDGVYGKIKLFEEENEKKKKENQNSIF